MPDPIWEHLFQTREWGRYPPESLIRFMARNFYKHPNRSEVKVLDAGCGTGACTWYLSREGFNVSGIDGSATGIAIAQKRLSEERLRAEMKVGDYLVLPWPDSEFDAVIDNASFCHNPIEDWQTAVNEVFRVLRPGGKLFSVSFTPESLPLKDRGYAYYASEDDLHKLLRAFTDIEIEVEARTIGRTTKTECWVVTATKPTPF